jgi:hypothetical protein
MKKTLYIIGLIIAIGLLAPSCKKEKTCSCKYKRTYENDANTYPFQLEIKIDDGNCEDITSYSTTDKAGLSFKSETSCVTKD